MKTEIRKLFAMKRPCKNCPFLKTGAIELDEGRLDGIKTELEGNDRIPFFCHKTTYKTGGEYAEHEDEVTYIPSGSESYCMGAMAYLYAVRKTNLPTRLGLAYGLCDIEDIRLSVEMIETDHSTE